VHDREVQLLARVLSGARVAHDHCHRVPEAMNSSGASAKFGMSCMSGPKTFWATASPPW
jgi:hypothetical protein